MESFWGDKTGSSVCIHDRQTDGTRYYDMDQGLVIIEKKNSKGKKIAQQLMKRNIFEVLSTDVEAKMCLKHHQKW